MEDQNSKPAESEAVNTDTLNANVLPVDKKTVNYQEMYEQEVQKNEKLAANLKTAEASIVISKNKLKEMKNKQHKLNDTMDVENDFDDEEGEESYIVPIPKAIKEQKQQSQANNLADSIDINKLKKFMESMEVETENKKISQRLQELGYTNLKVQDIEPKMRPFVAEKTLIGETYLLGKAAMMQKNIRVENPKVDVSRLTNIPQSSPINNGDNDRIDFVKKTLEQSISTIIKK